MALNYMDTYFLVGLFSFSILALFMVWISVSRVAVEKDRNVMRNSLKALEKQKCDIEKERDNTRSLIEDVKQQLQRQTADSEQKLRYADSKVADIKLKIGELNLINDKLSRDNRKLLQEISDLRARLDAAGESEGITESRQVSSLFAADPVQATEDNQQDEETGSQEQEAPDKSVYSEYMNKMMDNERP